MGTSAEAEQTCVRTSLLSGAFFHLVADGVTCRARVPISESLAGSHSGHDAGLLKMYNRFNSSATEQRFLAEHPQLQARLSG